MTTSVTSVADAATTSAGNLNGAAGKYEAQDRSAADAIKRVGITGR